MGRMMMLNTLAAKEAVQEFSSGFSILICSLLAKKKVEFVMGEAKASDSRSKHQITLFESIRGASNATPIIIDGDGSFSFIDLFAGIGGFRIALNKLNGHCIGFSEIDKEAILTYISNYQDDMDSNYGDITKIKYIPHVDMLVGGVPCQSWSVAGKMKGFEDPRGQLWNDVIRLVSISKPKTFINTGNAFI